MFAQKLHGAGIVLLREVAVFPDLAANASDEEECGGCEGNLFKGAARDHVSDRGDQKHHKTREHPQTHPLLSGVPVSYARNSQKDAWQREQKLLPGPCPIGRDRLPKYEQSSGNQARRVQASRPGRPERAQLRRGIPLYESQPKNQ